MNLLALLGFGAAVAGLGGLFFVTTGRRRRGTASAADLVPVAATMQQMSPPASAPAPRLAAPPAPGDEANVPRWLRASVRAERFQTTDRDTRAAPRLAPRRGARFSEPPLESATRMLVRYERVEVLDQPHEAYGRPLTEVGTNDEVDVLEAREAWALVQTPGGVTGWLPTMTLDRPASEGSTAGDEPEAPSEPPQARPRGRRATR